MAYQVVVDNSELDTISTKEYKTLGRALRGFLATSYRVPAGMTVFLLWDGDNEYPLMARGSLLLNGMPKIYIMAHGQALFTVDRVESIARSMALAMGVTYGS